MDMELQYVNLHGTSRNQKVIFLIVGLGRLGYLFNKGRNIFKRMELF